VSGIDRGRGSRLDFLGLLDSNDGCQDRDHSSAFRRLSFSLPTGRQVRNGSLDDVHPQPETGHGEWTDSWRNDLTCSRVFRLLLVVAGACCAATCGQLLYIAALFAWSFRWLHNPDNWKYVWIYGTLATVGLAAAGLGLWTPRRARFYVWTGMVVVGVLAAVMVSAYVRATGRL